jgi:hypothetical protein
MKYAVYVLIVEDTEAADVLLSMTGAESVDRVAGNIEHDDAYVAANAARIAALPYDEGIARE